MIVNWLQWTVIILVNAALIPYFLFLFAITVGSLRPRREESLPETPFSKFLVVIPAHDEAPVISAAVSSCLELNYPRSLFQVIVIADNCSDRTASLAADAGARVVERFDLLKKSKGFAINDLIDALRNSGELDLTDALVIVDADTTVDRDLLRAFDRRLGLGHDWVQAYYTVSNADESWRTRLMTYAFSLFNGVMPLGKTQLGMSASFKGNGMCFSVRGMKRVPWRCHGLVEDMEYSWAVRIAGERIVFEPDVSVHGAMLAKWGPAAANQRSRWEFGRKEMRRMFLRPLLRSNRLRFWEKVVCFCELTIPSLGALFVIYAGVALADGFFLLGLPPFARSFVRPFLFGCLGLMTTTLGFHAISPFLTLRLPWRYGLSVIWFPVYILWKFWVASGGRPDRWVRTARDSHGESANRLAEKSP